MHAASISDRYSGSCLRGVALLLIWLGAYGGLPADYFVREAGNDEHEGTSRETAWRSAERVNRARLRAGDRVLFEAGKRFRGGLVLTSEDAGASNAPVVIGSDGQAAAVLEPGNGNGISVVNAGNIVIRNLLVKGSGRTNNTGYGVLCDNTLTNRQRLKNLVLDQIEVSGFGIFGILIAGDHAGFEHVLVTNCVMRDNLRGGMEIAGRLPWDADYYAHADVRVTHCRAFGNTGDPTYLKNHSGSGMVLYQVDGGTMEYCAAWDNGTLCRAPGGGVGLWTCASRRVVIQRCESFANRTSGADGGGFDLDGGCVECVLQYNYSHDNDGPGLMVYSYPYASYADRGNIVRFNLSENDSRRGSRYAGLWIRNDGTNPMTNLEVYNNTVVIGSWASQAALVNGAGVHACLRNNIFFSNGAAVPLRVELPADALRFEHNVYWRQDGPVQVAWGTNLYSSLSEWREITGQESIAGKGTGIFGDPLFVNHQSTSAVNSSNWDGLRAFCLRSNSPAWSGGLDLRKRPNPDIGSCDLLGTKLPGEGPFPIGAIWGCVVEGQESVPRRASAGSN